MTKKIRVNSGEKVKIFSRSFSSMPLAYEFQARPLGSNQLNGEIEIVTRQILFAKPPTILPLQVSNTVDATMWDTFFDIYIRAGSDLEVTVPKRNFGPIRWVIVFAAVIVIAAISIFLFSI